MAIGQGRQDFSATEIGGVAGLLKSLARCGIHRFIIVDPDRVSLTNPTTQAHDPVDRGRNKAVALAARLRCINPRARQTTHPVAYQTLSSADRDRLWQADLVLAMTDEFHTQAQINRDALAAGVDHLRHLLHRF